MLFLLAADVVKGQVDADEGVADVVEGHQVDADDSAALPSSL